MCENCEGTGWVGCWCPMAGLLREGSSCAQCGSCDECGGTGK